MLVGLGPSLPQHPLSSPPPGPPSWPSGDSPRPGCASSVPQRHHQAPGAFWKRNSGDLGGAAVRGLFRSSAGFSPRPRCSSGSAVVFVCGPESCNARSPMDWIMCAVTGLGRKADTSQAMGARGLRLRECDVSRCVCVRASLCFFNHDGFKFPFFCREINLEIQYGGPVVFYVDTRGVSCFSPLPRNQRPFFLINIYFSLNYPVPWLQEDLAILWFYSWRNTSSLNFFVVVVFNPFRPRPAAYHIAR